MTDIVNKISGIAEIFEINAGSGRKRRKPGRARRDDHDSVTISEEARRLGTMEESEDLPVEDDTPTPAED